MTILERRSDIRSLLRLDEGLVHSDVYADPGIFDLEMERIFHQGWVYVGHEARFRGRAITCCAG